ncbi:MAG: hypothetical protein RL637_1045 [Pseudomonadota bacterium]|jgi:GDP-L-fucose synthase
MIKLEHKIYIAGHKGMVGSAIMRLLSTQGYKHLITRSHQELDLTNQIAVHEFMQQQRPDIVILAAAKVGGIWANQQYPAEFIYQNLMIEANVIHQAYLAGINRLLFLGSSCIYPKFAPQPMSEEVLLTGELEPTNEPYAIAKIAGIKLCESYNRQYATDYRSIMPTNLYGIEDHFDLQNSHVIPALMHRIHLAKSTNQTQVEVWGSGLARREFLHVDDMAAACLYVMQLNQPIYQQHTKTMLSHLNVGTGEDISIRELVELLVEIIDYQGEIIWNNHMPDGTPRKLLNTQKLTELGWKAQIPLRSGLAQTYQWYLANITT